MDRRRIGGIEALKIKILKIVNIVISKGFNFSKNVSKIC